MQSAEAIQIVLLTKTTIEHLLGTCIVDFAIIETCKCLIYLIVTYLQQKFTIIAFWSWENRILVLTWNAL